MFGKLRKAKTPAPPHLAAPDPESNPISTVRRLVRAHQDEAAIRLAFTRVMADLERAYSLTILPGWTLPEIVGRGFDERLAGLDGPVLRLYALYRPLRFGPPQRDWEAEAVEGLLDIIYGHRPMFELYFRGRLSDSPRAEADASILPAGALTSGPRTDS